VQLAQSDKDALVELFLSGQHAQAFDRAEVLARQFPEALDAWNIRGAAALELGQLKDAEQSFRQLEKLAPDLPSGPYNLGILLEKMNDDAGAVEAYKRAISVATSSGSAHNNLGGVYLRIGQADLAYQHFKRAEELQPYSPQVHNNLGNVLKRWGRLNEAQAAYARAAKIEPDFAAAFYNLGTIASEKGDRDSALELYRRVLAIEPDHALAKAMLLNELSHRCDWEEAAKYAGAIPKLGIEGAAVPPFLMLALEDNPARQLLRSRNWAHARYRRGDKPARVFPCPKKRPERLRLGYLSADFHDHPGMRLMTGVFGAHDRSRFEVHAISYGPSRQDDWREKAHGAVDVFHDVNGWADSEVLRLLNDLKLDVAIDRQGYTTNTRIEWFAQRIAPVQLSYLGYCSTLALPFVDYFVADKIVIPPHLRAHYDEKIIWLPDCYQPVNNGLEIAPSISARLDHGLPEEAIVLCCFNNLYKITPEVFAIWTRVMSQIEGSVLWLFGSNPAAQDNLRNAVEAAGIDPKRLVFAPRIDHAKHLERHRHADIFLDTSPYNAHTTCNDALLAGLPVVTKIGEQMASRVAASILQAAGLPELITHSWEEYEELVLELAKDERRRGAIRAKLASLRSTAPFFDTAMFTRNLEKGFDAAYGRFLKGLAPADISVSRGRANAGEFTR
jgi:protein O-GlcNAc transferase